jgi:FAD:protein FMN transferase
MKNRCHLFSLLCFFAGTAVAAPAAPPPAPVTSPYERDFAAMNTAGRLTLWAPRATAVPAAAAVVAEIQALERTLNRFDPASELSRLNATAARQPFVCGDRLWAVLNEARRAYRDTGGAFDISIGPLMRVWGFHAQRASWPAPAELAAAKALVGLNRVVFDDAAHSVRLPAPGCSLDCGGIAKGYALDAAAAILRRHGLRCGLLDFGGNLLCLEEPPPGTAAYDVGVRDPEQPAALAARLLVCDGAVATSGAYEQQRVLGTRRVTHIMDPATGQPVPGRVAVTVVTSRGVDSDVYSTAIFVAGPALAERFCAADPRREVRIWDHPPGGPVTLRHFGAAPGNANLPIGANRPPNPPPPGQHPSR